MKTIEKNSGKTNSYGVACKFPGFEYGARKLPREDVCEISGCP
jgi:hypothetical protein